MNSNRWLAAAAFACAVVGCSTANEVASDGGTTMVDAGAADAGAADAGIADAGAADAGPADAGGGLYFYDGGPPNMSCAADAGLTAAELQLVQMPANSWLSVPGTEFKSFCTTHLDAGVYGPGCSAVITAWSGGAFDDANRQLLLWGGGHGDYWGNEVYGFQIASMSWHVVKAATPVDSSQLSVDPYYDGNPSARHTYGQLAYLGDLRQMFAYGGSRAGNGFSLSTTWLFDPQSETWTQRADSVSASAGNFWGAAAYDERTHTVYVRDEDGIASYDVAADTWTRLVDFGYRPYWPAYQSYNYRTAVVVPDQRLYIAAGGKLPVDGGGVDFVVYDIDAGADITSSYSMSGEPTALLTPGAGMALAPSAHDLVAWSGGPPSILDLQTHAWSTGSAAGAPSAQVQNGTFGRFRYISYLNVFVLVNQPSDDVYFYKLTPGCGP